jgi:dethiobiotin synthetase
VLRGALVTATDTGVGKTILAAAIIAALVARGEPVVALKPAVTGLDETVRGSSGGSSGSGLHDHELLALCAGGVDPHEVSPYRFGPPASPHLAAALADRPIDVPGLVRRARSAGQTATLIVEGVGGLLVPLAPGWDIRAFAAAVGLPVVIAARPGLGTINHTLLTLEAARAADLDIRAVVLTPWPQRPSVVEQSNRETIAELGGGVAVGVLPHLGRIAPDELARAGSALPLDAWIARADASL